MAYRVHVAYSLVVIGLFLTALVTWLIANVFDKDHNKGDKLTRRQNIVTYSLMVMGIIVLLGNSFGLVVDISKHAKQIKSNIGMGGRPMTGGMGKYGSMMSI